MINYNGNLLEENTQFLDHQNRGLRYGDALFETMRMVNGKLFFWEDHYLRLMASMRVLRMEIPMDFTMEFLESKISETVEANGLANSQARIRFSVFREKGGFYLPTTNDISYCIEALPLQSPFYVVNDAPYEVELFKDFYVNADMLSTLKTNNKIINVVGSIYAKENDYQNCLLLNSSKQVVEALNGNIFIVKNGSIKTPPIKEGCLNGIVRKKLIEILSKIDEYQFEEASISPFELQKADEIFITNSIVGIQPISKYRKKEFANTVAKGLLGKLNAAARLS
ncbi:aminotransferase class IV [Zobellia alginiliquefaciens]|uniref:aminotransferase class IV n=1 Tax=Zobellia alginiliquefaciens TaxID=3032586 RepID=UPI0023E466D8|nr:aminotransferase class IV [Zobellia alginiliquefaciens]